MVCHYLAIGEGHIWFYVAFLVHIVLGFPGFIVDNKFAATTVILLSSLSVAFY
jgi:hypothetical protein